MPGAWVGGAVRSPVARGELRGFEIDPTFDLSRVVLVRPEDLPGDNVVALIEDDMPILADGAIAHVGEALLLVAAPDAGTLAEALAAIRPKVHKLPPVLDMEQSERVFKSIAIEKGDVDQAFETCEVAIEHVYHTDTQEQMYIEPQGFVAWPPDGDGVVRVEGSLQCPFYVRTSLARALGIEPAQARVVQAVTGGGFGGKEDYPSVVACHAALLARAAGRPVKVIYDRHEDLAVTPKRHPARIRHRTAVDTLGRLVAMEIDVLLDGGAFATLSSVVLSRACIHAVGPYRCDNVRVRGRVVATNHVPYGAFRGFGAPQVCFAVERQMDRIARALALHPAHLRRANMLRTGDTTATGQRLDASVGSEEVLERALAGSGFDGHAWRGTSKTVVAGGRRVRRGLGLSLFFHGAGFTGSGEELLKARVALELTPTGAVRIRTAATEIGQGTLTLFLALAAEALEAPVSAVEIAPADTGAVPDSGPTVASRTCMIVGRCLQRACAELRARVEATVGTDGPFRERAARFVAGGGETTAEVVYDSPPGLHWNDASCEGDAYPAYGWAADVAEVEVDLDTFEVRVTRFWTTADVGKAIQPQLVEGQLEGGALQAIGFAHLEVVRSAGGRVLQDRMSTCVIPGALDAPPMEVELVEIPFPHGPCGAKGVGELPMDGGAPAVVSAIEDAIGVQVDRIPATPERLMEAWLCEHPEERL